MSGQDFTSQLKLAVMGEAIDSSTEPPRGCKGDIETQRPCLRTACRFHLWRQEEIPGRPHNAPPGELPNGRPDGGSRPPARLRVIDQSCLWDVTKANPEGMTADEVGEILGSPVDAVGNHQVVGGVPVRHGDVPPKTAVGERMLQLEQRAMLKLKAVEHVFAILQEAREHMPNGTEVVDIVPHNLHAEPNEHFVTVRVRVREQTAKSSSGRGGVVVRRKKP